MTQRLALRTRTHSAIAIASLAGACMTYTAPKDGPRATIVFSKGVNVPALAGLAYGGFADEPCKSSLGILAGIGWDSPDAKTVIVPAERPLPITVSLSGYMGGCFLAIQFVPRSGSTYSVSTDLVGDGSDRKCVARVVDRATGTAPTSLQRACERT
jgi:hypothetical protein